MGLRFYALVFSFHHPLCPSKNSPSLLVLTSFAGGGGGVAVIYQGEGWILFSLVERGCCWNSSMWRLWKTWNNQRMGCLPSIGSWLTVLGNWVIWNPWGVYLAKWCLETRSKDFPAATDSRWQGSAGAFLVLWDNTIHWTSSDSQFSTMGHLSWYAFTANISFGSYPH